MESFNTKGITIEKMFVKELQEVIVKCRKISTISGADQC